MLSDHKPNIARIRLDFWRLSTSSSHILCALKRRRGAEQLERFHPRPYGCSGGHGFLHGGSAYAPRLGYLLRVVLYPVGESEGLSGRNHAPSGPAVDGTDGAQRDDAEVGISGQQPISTA